ncbi:MAG: CHASE2 domain-containing protein [Alphaproteobacteria bacterium]|nr:CHASE2 domain-containing protein [Alphaproteobacteria bacterium]
MLRWLGRNLSIFVGLAAVGGLLVLRASDPQFLAHLRLLAFDSYQRIQPRAHEDAPVVIVDIDDASLEKLGQWPLPRTILAALVDRLMRLQAATIGIDVLLAEPDRTSPAEILRAWGASLRAAPDLAAFHRTLDAVPDPDRVLAAVIGRPDAKVVTGFALGVDVMPRVPVVKAEFATAGDALQRFAWRFAGAVASLTAFESAAKGNGALNVIIDYDTILRRVPLVLSLDRGGGSTGPTLYPSLVAEALRVAQGARTLIVRSSGARGEASLGESTGMVSIKIGRYEIPVTARGEIWVHYARPRADRYVPAWQVLDGGVPPARIAGKVVLIGTSAIGVRDIRATPLRPDMPGVEVHAQALEQVLTGAFLTRPDWIYGLEVLVLALSGLVVVVLLRLAGPRLGAVVVIGAIAASAGASWYCFSVQRLLLDPVYPALLPIVLYLCMSTLSTARR